MEDVNTVLRQFNFWRYYELVESQKMDLWTSLNISSINSCILNTEIVETSKLIE